MKGHAFKRHTHKWVELLPRGDGARTTFVVCKQCETEGHDSVKYLGAKATAEFRRQVRYGIVPHFKGNALIGHDWKK